MRMLAVSEQVEVTGRGRLNEIGYSPIRRTE